MSNSYIINRTENKAEILLYGYIGNWDKNDSAQFISDFRKLESENKNIAVRINSGGGDVFEGIAIFNAIKNSTAEITTYIDGIAASMASVIALAGKRIFMSKHAQIMVHKVSGNANGDSDKLRETANLMDSLEHSLLEIYSERTGKSVEAIQQTWMQRGKDTWFTASEALKENLIDEIYEGDVKKKPAKNVTDKELWAYYNVSIENNLTNTKNEMEILNQLKTLCKLSDSASVNDVVTSLEKSMNEMNAMRTEIEKLQHDNAEYENKFKELNKQKIVDLIEHSIKAKRITEAQRSVYMALAESNFEMTKQALEAITPYQSITSQLQMNTANESEMSFTEWQKNDPKGLLQMKRNDFERFACIYEKQFGKRPIAN